MILKLFKKWFGKKVDEAEKKNKGPHRSFFKIPIGARLGGIIKFKPSSESYFLLNEEKILTKLPEEKTQVVIAISTFQLFGLTIYRAYIEAGSSYLQFHYDGATLLDILYFKDIEKISLKLNPRERERWQKIIGDEDIKTPTGITFLRDWSPDEKGHINPTPLTETYFKEPSDILKIDHQMMLYCRTLEGGKDGEDIEYLLSTIKKSWQETIDEVNLQTGIRMEATDLEIM
jgi:hypothetical protein